MSSSDRQELIRNAVAFLADPKVLRLFYLDFLFYANFTIVQTQSSSLSQRVQFLETKGLTPVEIDMAMKQAALVGTVPHPERYLPIPYGPPTQNWDWRDYFVNYPAIDSDVF